MRISTSSFYSDSVSTMNQLQVNLAQTQQQVASGRRILSPADDPAAAARAVELNQSDSANTQYGSNRTAATNTLSLSESMLQSVTSLLQDAKTTAVYAGNGTLNQTDRQTLAADLQGRLQELLGLANSTDGVGNYLFSGAQGSVQAFANAAGGVQYQGDDVQRKVQAAPTRQISTTDSGADIFMRIRNGNGTFVSAAATAPMTLSTAATIAADILPATGSVVTVASTNALVPGMTITGAGFPAGTTVLAVTNATTFTTTQAGTVGVGATVQFGGANFGSGIISPGSVTNPALFNGNNYQVTFGVVGGVTSYSVTDVTNPAAPAAVAGQTNIPYVSGQAISFNGIQFDIQGVPGNADVFNVTPSVNQSMFATLTNLIATLNAPMVPGNPTVAATYRQGLTDALNNLDHGLNNVLGVRATIGARMNELDALNATGESLGLQYKQTLSKIQDTDYTKAISDLTQQNMILQAAQKSFAQVSGMSLFNYIK